MWTGIFTRMPSESLKAMVLIPLPVGPVCIPLWKKNKTFSVVRMVAILHQHASIFRSCA